eukprot:1058889-Prorocentrum_minimum.AAC.2
MDCNETPVHCFMRDLNDARNLAFMIPSGYASKSVLNYEPVSPGSRHVSPFTSSLELSTNERLVSRPSLRANKDEKADSESLSDARLASPSPGLLQRVNVQTIVKREMEYAHLTERGSKNTTFSAPIRGVRRRHLLVPIWGRRGCCADRAGSCGAFSGGMKRVLAWFCVWRVAFCLCLDLRMRAMILSMMRLATENGRRQASTDSSHLVGRSVMRKAGGNGVPRPRTGARAEFPRNS